MGEKLVFSEEFIQVLDMLKVDTNKTLIYSMYVISSNVLDREKKERFFSDVSAFGLELRNIIVNFRLEKITRFNIRESEKVFVDAARQAHQMYLKQVESAEKRFGLAIERNTLFDITEIIARLKDKSVYTEYMVSKDKIDNLLSVKTLINAIYENQTKRSIENEANMDKQLFQIKEKAFLQSLFNAANINPLYFYKAVQLFKKYVINEGKQVVPATPGSAAGGSVLVGKDSANEYSMEYRSTDINLSVRVSKIIRSGSFLYAVAGEIEKGTAKVEFRVNETVPADKELSFERITGIDFVFGQYESMMIRLQTSEDSLKLKEEALNKKIVDKAIDDLLFS